MAGNPNLIEQYRQIHAASVYGNTSVKNLRFLRPEVRLLRPRSILDYGCGQSLLLEQLRLPYQPQLIRYDPAIPEYSRKPHVHVDLLINIDVLEHIEEQDLDAVLDEMASISRNAVIIIDTAPAATFLPDGRNAHVTIRPHRWWHDRLSRHFPTLVPLATARRSRAGFKTWRRSPGQTFKYIGFRVAEDVTYYGRRVLSPNRCLAGIAGTS